MGAVASIEAQAKDPSLFTAMVLDCPFDSSESIVKRGLDNMKFQFFGYRFNVPARDVLQKYSFHPYVQSLMKTFLKSLSYVDIRNIDVRLYPVNTAEVVHKIQVPCFFIHCRNDEKVGTDSVKILYEKVGSNYKKLWITNGRCHYDSFFYNPEEYIKRVREFVDKAAAGKFDKTNKQEIMEDKPDIRLSKGYIWGIGKLET
jgi:pimeloyl-ACP methyl ester carboxylesterase